MSGAWRWRECPECGGEFPAGEIKPVKYGSHWRQQGWAKRRCPGCGYVTSTKNFRVVADLRARRRR